MPSTGMPSAIFSSMPREPGELVLQLAARARARPRSAAAHGSRRARPSAPRRAASAGRRPRTRGSDRPRRRRTRRGTDAARSAGRRRGCRRAPRTRRDARPCRRGGRRARRAAPRPRRGRGRAPPIASSTGATSVRPAASGWIAPRTDAVTTSGVSPLQRAMRPSTSSRRPTISALGLSRSCGSVSHAGKCSTSAPGSSAPSAGPSDSARRPVGATTRRTPGLPGAAAALEQGREQRGVEALDEREVGIDGCRGHGIPERLRLLEGAHDPGNCHREESTRGPGGRPAAGAR